MEIFPVMHPDSSAENEEFDWAEEPVGSGYETVAAVDLGSNSFHMLVARWHQGEVITVDRLKETVRLAAGLDQRNRLNDEARQRALACLERFGQRLRTLPPGSVRALGTNTLRKAKGSRNFLELAETALGHPVEIISGREEARLIYLGVAHSLADLGGRRLVIDIGGGSTEFIIGEDFEPRLAESLQLGCVTFTMTHFPDARISAARFRQAELHAELELQPIVSEYRALGWQQVLGSSGTLLALDEILRTEAIEKEAGISLHGLETLKSRLIDAGEIGRVDLSGLSEERKAVLVGGLAVAIAIFRSLGIDRMTTSSGAMREGVVHDLFGRLHHQDVRGQTIHHLRKRFAVDAAHAARTLEEVRRLLGFVRKQWKLSEADGDLLDWAAELHEIGLALSHSQYHRHGEYILTHADLAGFSRQEQAELALLVRVHRRSFRPKQVESYSRTRRRKLIYLAVLLRLAVLLHRSRTEDPVPLEQVETARDQIELVFAAGWLEAHPLTRADLEQEAAILEGMGMRLRAR